MYLRRFSVTSVSSMSRAQSRYNRYFLLKSYCSHFSLYSCFSHIQAICQVTMTGAGMCKQDICIQEITLLQYAFSHAVTMREPEYGYSSAEGGHWKIASADRKAQTSAYRDISNDTHTNTHKTGSCTTSVSSIGFSNSDRMVTISEFHYNIIMAKKNSQ